jgi:hypothetical protein
MALTSFAPAPTDVASLLDLTTNPADRLWRYPACRPLLKLAMKTPVTPNQITILHTALSLGAGAIISVGTPRAFMLAGAIFELRSILDCLDGALARAKGASSPFGRALDQMGDTIGFLSLMGGALVCFARQYGWLVAPLIVLTTMAISAACTTAWDLFRQRFTSLILHGYDSTEDEYVALCRRYQEHKRVSLWVSRTVSLYGWLTLSPQTLPRLRDRIARGDWPREGETPAVTPLGHALRQAAERGDLALRRNLRRVGFVGGDNLILLLTLGLLSGQYLRAFPIVMVWGLAVWGYTVATVGGYLRQVSRDCAQSA